VEVILAVVADSASITEGGNLDVVGIFDTIPTRGVPVSAPRMSIVFTIRREPGDVSPVGLTVDVVDADGQEIVKWHSAIIGSSPSPGRFVHLHLVLPCPPSLVFPRLGSYRARLLAGDDHLGSALFQVALLDP